MSNLLSIGDFSTVSQLTVKALRFYHEKGILIPARVEAGTGYRFYAPGQVERAAVIRRLRDLDFSVREIRNLLTHASDDADILSELENRHAEITRQLADDRRTQRKLAEIITQVRNQRGLMKESTSEIEEKSLEPVLVAALRMRGRYSECGKGFGTVGRKFGSKINGKAMLLCHDTEYKEDDADYSVCMPIRSGKDRGDIIVIELPGGRCVSLIHKGPYDSLGQSYERVFAWIAERGYQPLRPTREVYLKGPGMIFKGNPANYLTEIQVLVE